ncbi:MAG: ribbon-helix-helix domain-containing protein [Candidatus Xenobia bacterium]
MASRNQKATFVLPAELVGRMQEAVHSGLVPSVSELVREAISSYLKDLERDRFAQDMEAAAADPMFMADLDASMAAFEFADAESARLMESW